MDKAMIELHVVVDYDAIISLAMLLAALRALIRQIR
jgi:hypothetical protein